MEIITQVVLELRIKDLMAVQVLEALTMPVEVVVALVVLVKMVLAIIMAMVELGFRQALLVLR
jgi:hypothetical protein